MKKIIIIILAVTLLFSCKKEVKKIPLPTSIAGLKLEKVKQEKAKDSISKRILDLEYKLTELDTVKKLQLVSVLPIKLENFEHFISIQGSTKTDKNLMVRPLSTGIITGVYIKEGQRVHNGQKMFQLDDSILRNGVFEVENQLKLAQTSFDRQQRLWKQKIGSEMQFLQAKNNKESLENKIITLKSQLKNYRVTAPFSGIVDDLIAVKGNLASPQTPLAQIINLDKIYIESDVAENYLTSIKKGSKSLVNFTAINKEIVSKIAKVGHTINPENRTFKVRINVPNRKGEIKPNLLADIKIKDFSEQDAIVIPSNLVQIDENGNNFVFTITKTDNKNIVTKKPITVKSSYQEKSLVSKGLTKDDTLINEGSRNVSSQQEVSIYVGK